MNKDSVLKSLKFNFATSIFAAIIAIAAFETGFLTKGVLLLHLTEQDIYYVEVATILLFIVLVVNIFVYYGISYDGAMYCGIVSFGALLYSCPTEKVLDDLMNGDGTK